MIVRPESHERKVSLLQIIRMWFCRHRWSWWWEDPNRPGMRYRWCTRPFCQRSEGGLKPKLESEKTTKERQK